MIKKISLGILLLASHLMGEVVPPQEIATIFTERLCSDVLAGKNTLDVVGMWHEATSPMTHDEKIKYTKDFLAVLEKQQAAMLSEQALEQERLLQQAKQLDIQQAHADTLRAEQDFNQRIKIGVGIASAIVIAVAIYCMMSSAPSVATARAARAADPPPHRHCPPPVYASNASCYPPDQPCWESSAPASNGHPSYSFGYRHPVGFSAKASTGAFNGVYGSYESPSAFLRGAIATGKSF